MRRAPTLTAAAGHAGSGPARPARACSQRAAAHPQGKIVLRAGDAAAT